MFVFSCCIATTTSYRVLTRCLKKYHVVMSGHTIALILWLPSIKVSNSPSWYTFELHENKSSGRMLSEGKDFQAHSDLIHGNGSPNECSSPSAVNIIIVFALIRQVGWMRATCSIFKGQILFISGTGLTKSHEKASYNLRSNKTDKQPSICNSSSPTPSSPKPKWKDRKIQNPKEML